jgi:AcrR family transcriptional regulator
MSSSIHSVHVGSRYTEPVPRLWNETIDSHRRAVRDATLDTTASLVAEHGLAAVTMSQIAQATGIGRATLYKYFADVDSIMLAWHERQIAHHLHHLERIRDRPGGAGQRLHAVLEAYAVNAHGHPGTELAAALHRGAHVNEAQQRLVRFLQELIVTAVAEGTVRSDVAAEELAQYCLSALGAASALGSKAAIRRLVAVVMTGLRPVAPADR